MITLKTEKTEKAQETVAENAADGILAPLLWAAVLGPVGGMCYKAVNVELVGRIDQTVDEVVTWSTLGSLLCKEGFQSAGFRLTGGGSKDDALTFLNRNGEIAGHI